MFSTAISVVIAMSPQDSVHGGFLYHSLRIQSCFIRSRMISPETVLSTKNTLLFLLTILWVKLSPYIFLYFFFPHPCKTLLPVTPHIRSPVLPTFPVAFYVFQFQFHFDSKCPFCESLLVALLVWSKSRSFHCRLVCVYWYYIKLRQIDVQTEWHTGLIKRIGSGI